ncbi:hypothetical protein QYS49_24085 [Marivirga salinae]|uniref:Uncharacterized protein n=1 Tax=Marivirga salinarum TaxID=3059078 RepID=A0AA49GAT0_9BACT|nr:DUF6544 family protein [Marivirga sp. BDSF4-3]WKK74747.2 hypothetical protein QYS49_24085 [Marivirga sp. BDSF4-3]
MKIAFLIIVIIHGLLHLLGFIKGIGFKEIKELTMPISKPVGLLWLLTAIVFLAYGVLFTLNNKYAWLLGFIAVLISQILIILFWKDAKFGTLPNIVVLIVSMIFYGHFNFQEMVAQETTNLISQSKTSKTQLVSESDLNDLPKPVKMWLKNSGVIGKPFITKGKVIQEAKLKMKPEQEDWLDAKAIQYTTIDIPAFLWQVDVKMNSIVNFQGRDKFIDGKGEMLIKLNSLINIVDEKGEKLNEGTMQRYLGEMVWFPSLALRNYISWKQTNDSTATATMEYQGTKATGTFFFNSDGDFIKFSADRFKGNEKNSKRYKWILTVEEYNSFEGIKVPSIMKATWKLENKDWTWLKLEIKDINYNENAVF